MPSLALLATLLSVLVSRCPPDPTHALSWVLDGARSGDAGGDRAGPTPADLVFWVYDHTGPGASVAVIKDGKVVFERGYGEANLETMEAATPRTNYRLASITKQFTAMAVMMLADRKLLSIDDPVAKYLPELAALAPGVTLRHLLTHTSGLPDYAHLLPEDQKTQISDKDVLELARHLTTPVVPGKAFHYSNTGYALLALVIERVSKLSYGEFLHRNIFQPLGMTHTMTYAPDAEIPDRAFGYSAQASGAVPADQTATTAVLGDGGIYSSCHDLVRWVRALQRGALVDPELLAEATRGLVPTNKPGVAYGFGWRISDLHGERLVWHTGTTSGFKNALLWVPSKKLAVIILTNRRQGAPLRLGMLLATLYWN